MAQVRQFPPKLLLSMEKNLAQAKTLTQDPREQARIRLVEREFIYLKNLASVFYFYHAYRLNPSWEMFEPLAKAIEARNALIDSWYDDKGKLKMEDGWPRFFDNVTKDFLKVGGRLTGELSTPFNWNVATLGVDAPNPGTTWCMNLGRENHVPDPAKDFRGSAKYIELPLWSPNLEARAFCTPAAFGELVFGE